MKLIVGLGNPGPQYETTRHNAGFLMIDLLADKAGITWEGAASKFSSEIAKGQLFGESCVLLKPMTFMNRSGRPVGDVMRFYKVPPQDVIVLHDDIDVPSGKVKAREGGGHGGHNGIRSIIEETGQQGFHRIKLGVGRPESERAPGVVDWVLGQMGDEELQQLESIMLESVLVRLKGLFDRDSAGRGVKP